MRVKPIVHCWFHNDKIKSITLREELRFFFFCALINGFRVKAYKKYVLPIMTVVDNYVVKLIC